MNNCRCRQCRTPVSLQATNHVTTSIDPLPCQELAFCSAAICERVFPTFPIVNGPGPDFRGCPQRPRVFASTIANPGLLLFLAVIKESLFSKMNISSQSDLGRFDLRVRTEICRRSKHFSDISQSFHQQTSRSRKR